MHKSTNIENQKIDLEKGTADRAFVCRLITDLNK